MPVKPIIKRAVAFIDGQNLFRCAKNTFGYSYPNYNVKALATEVCNQQGWQLHQVRFYTGIPDPKRDPDRNMFWVRKLSAMQRQKIVTFTRPMRYCTKTVRLNDGSKHLYDTADEKGIDVRIAIDLIRLAHTREYDVALLFSQDQDFAEAALEIRQVAKEQDRWIKIAGAFPWSPTAPNKRGVNNTDWIHIERATYDTCLDKNDYRRLKALP